MCSSSEVNAEMMWRFATFQLILFPSKNPHWFCWGQGPPSILFESLMLAIIETFILRVQNAWLPVWTPCEQTPFFELKLSNKVEESFWRPNGVHSAQEPTHPNPYMLRHQRIAMELNRTDKLHCSSLCAPERDASGRHGQHTKRQLVLNRARQPSMQGMPERGNVGDGFLPMLSVSSGNRYQRKHYCPSKPFGNVWKHPVMSQALPFPSQPNTVNIALQNISTSEQMACN